MHHRPVGAGHDVVARVQRRRRVGAGEPALLGDLGDCSAAARRHLDLGLGRRDRRDVLGVFAAEVATVVGEDAALRDRVRVLAVEEQQAALAAGGDLRDLRLDEHELARVEHLGRVAVELGVVGGGDVRAPRTRADVGLDDDAPADSLRRRRAPRQAMRRRSSGRCGRRAPRGRAGSACRSSSG